MLRSAPLLFCLAASLGYAPSLRAEYASVMAPEAEDKPRTGLLTDVQADEEGSVAGLRFLSPIYLKQFQRESMGGAMPWLPPLPPTPLKMNDEGAGPPPLIDSPYSAAVATLTGEFRLVADPCVGLLFQFADRMVLQRSRGKLFRPPRGLLPNEIGA